jgi:diacylglycerol kinase family enzyme
VKKERILFVLNPSAGTGKAKQVEEALSFTFPSTHFETEVCYPNKLPSQQLKEKIGDSSWSKVVVAGGDGTINQVGRHLINTKTVLGMIPTGSGNGLARHFDIPFKVQKALQVIKRDHQISIDAGIITSAEQQTKRSHPFFNIAGIGFDARVAEQFNKQNIGEAFNMYGIPLESCGDIPRRLTNWNSRTSHLRYKHNSWPLRMLLNTASVLKLLRKGKYRMVI